MVKAVEKISFPYVRVFSFSISKTGMFFSGKDSPSSGSGDSGKSEENEKTTGDEDVSWDAFLNEGPVGGDEELMEVRKKDGNH